MTKFMMYALIVAFLSTLVAVSYFAKRSEKTDSSENFIIGGRGIGTFVLMFSMGATYFSTWTLLGAFGSYYRDGVWFAGFTVWTIFHAIFIWLFGTRIWLAGKRYGFITPGQMFEHYYHSRRMRLLVALTGMVALVPVMLIQVTGGAMALATLSQGGVPYIVGAGIMSLMVGAIVLWTGFKGTAWTDTFMGIFFATILIFTVIFVVRLAGGTEMFVRIAEYRPEVLINSGNPLKMLELWLGLCFGVWTFPHMWQKYYSASSAEVLGKVTVLTPFWNSWMMAGIPLLVGLAASIPGIAPGVDAKTSDTILPLIFTSHAPLMGALIVSGILAAAISTINSQLLSAASLAAEDVWVLWRGKANSEHSPRITRIVIIAMTLVVFALAVIPGGSGFIVPVASLGYGLALQLVPSALGILYFRRISESGAFYGLLAGVLTMTACAIIKPALPFGPAMAGIIVNIAVTLLVSLRSAPVAETSIRGYHDMFDRYMRNNIS